jgi:two-component system response regulator YesN
MNLRENSRSQIDAGNKEIDLEHVRKFLSSGTIKETDDFIDQILQNVGEEFASLPIFCRYLTMSIYFAAIKYLDSIGCSIDILWSPEFRPDDSISTIDAASRYVHKVIKQTIELRDLESIKQQRDILRQAIDFIDKNFSDASISLDRVAKEVNISPNYLSAIFSQEVGQTLIDYLTLKRIDEAKRMLRQTDKLLFEIASEVGYKDSRYFSFVFKKIAGCTPSDYRKGAKQ